MSFMTKNSFKLVTYRIHSSSDNNYFGVNLARIQNYFKKKFNVSNIVS